MFFMAVKSEILIVHSVEQRKDDVWEYYINLVGLLSIDACAHFSMVSAGERGCCSELLGLADYVIVTCPDAADVLKGLYGDNVKGVICLGEEDEASRKASCFLTHEGNTCPILSGDCNSILRKLMC